MRGLRETRALVAPALPAERRTTVGSRQFIAGVPLDQSDMGSSAGTCDLRTLFGGGDELPVRPLDLVTVRAGEEAIARVLSGIDRGIVIADARV